MPACGSGDTASDGFVTVSPEYIDLGDIEPGNGAIQAKLTLSNTGGRDAWLTQATLNNLDTACGAFELVDEIPRKNVPPGGSTTLTLSFKPDDSVEAGCACHAVAFLNLVLRPAPGVVKIPLVVRGACDDPLRCVPGAIDFGKAVVDFVYEDPVECFNVDPGKDRMLEKVGVTDDGDGSFSITDVIPSHSASLKVGDSVKFNVHYVPPQPGTHQGMVTLDLESGSMDLPLKGEADRARPLCSDGFPSDPEPVLRGDGYTILLEGDTPADAISSYPGVVRSFWFYDDQPPMIGDVLVTSGSKADPDCEVGQNGHTAYWKGQACVGSQDDLFINVHAIPFSDTVETWIRRLELWDKVTVRGYEVDRVNYDNGGYWTDAGCHTMIITWLCDN
ncbi:MAG: choice-of-anchor D domain-containing protein [Deltaproteobacteria bacterium]|nr:choice-of-anchor D domain-containing protein [Deltaproteobacteria bacterium]